MRRVFNSAWLLVCAALVACQSSDDSAESQSEQLEALAVIEVANPSAFERQDETIAIPLLSLGLLGEDRTLALRAADQLLPHQWVDRNGDGDVDHVVTQVTVAPGAKLAISVNQDAEAMPSWPSRAHAEISHKVGGQWNGRHYEGGEWQSVATLTPPDQHTDHSEFIRYEGPGIESDRVGYRVYLDERNGFDIFGKRTADLVLAQVGLEDFEAYHNPADWGMDVLKVGNSLGMGGFGAWVGEDWLPVSSVSGWTTTIDADGPIEASFTTRYHDWQVSDQTTQLQARLTMHGGSRLVHVELEADHMPERMVTGLVKHAETTLLQGSLDITGQAWTYLATWGAQSLDGGNLGMAVFVRRKDVERVTQDAENQMVILKPHGDALDYYFAAAWDKEPDGITTETAFRSWLEATAERLTIRSRVRVDGAFSRDSKPAEINRETVLDLATRLAQSERARQGDQLKWGEYDQLRQRAANWEYTTGLLMQSFDQLAATTGDQALKTHAVAVIDSYLSAEGEIASYRLANHNIDSINSGKMLLRLYRETQARRYRDAADILRNQLHTHPRLDAGAFWHKQRYPGQLWLDGVYMGMPFLVEYGQLFQDSEALPMALEEFHVVYERLKDPATGLYWHAWDERREQGWADPETGLSRHFWGRGMGWLAMAIVDTWGLIPESESEARLFLAQMGTELAEDLLRYQDVDTQTWYQVIDRPDAIGNYREASVSAMVTYMLTKGVNEGMLDADRFASAALAAYQGLVNSFVELRPDGSAIYRGTVEVGGLGYGRDGSYRYYMSEPIVDNDPKGLGPFLLASVEIARLLNNEGDQ